MDPTLIVGLIMLVIGFVTTFMALIKMNRSKIHAARTLERRRSFTTGLIILAAAVVAFGLGILFVGSAGIRQVAIISAEREMTIFAGLLLAAIGLVAVVVLSITLLFTKQKAIA